MTSLLIEEHGYGIFVCSINGDTGGRTFSRIGQRVPLHATGSGKAILAHLPTEKIHTIVDRHGLDAYTPNTITTQSALVDELEVIHSQGYAIDDEERRIGSFCIGVPILTETNVLGAISISGPKFRMLEDKYVE